MTEAELDQYTDDIIAQVVATATKIVRITTTHFVTSHVDDYWEKERIQAVGDTIIAGLESLTIDKGDPDAEV